MTKQTHRMLPDLGITLCARNYYDPFRIEVYSDLNYGVDGVLGWVIQIPLHTFALTSVGNTPPPNIDRPHLATIAIGKGSKSRTVKIVNRLQTEGLIVQAWEAKKYLVPSGVEWVVPLKYIKESALQKKKNKGFQKQTTETVAS